MESCNFTNKANSHTPKEEIHTRPKLCYFDLYVVRATLFCLKSFVPVTGLECSHGKIFITVTEISVAKTEILVTGPAQPLIWTHRYFYKENSGEKRSQKPSQPGWPGSYEEALNRLAGGIKIWHPGRISNTRETKHTTTSKITVCLTWNMPNFLEHCWTVF